jgi:hypothetical protein
VAVGCLLLASPTSAWPQWLPEPDALFVRQGGTTTTQTTQTSVSPSLPSSTGGASSSQGTTNGGLQQTTGNLNTGGLSPTGTNANKTSAPTHTQYNPVDPPGQVVMLTPAPTAAASPLYKIGSSITFGWNYTGLSATPTAIDVLVTVSSTQIYTLTQNMTFSTLGSYTWDTGSYASQAIGTPLGTEEYTLVIYDAQSQITAQGEAGYLAAYSAFQFGMYTPQPYTSFNDGWSCASCKSAASGLDRSALGLALTMSMLTVLGFSWFVLGLGGLV